MLSIQNVSKTFHAGTINEVRALTDVSIDLDDGSFLIIIGMNGSGKSTILNAVAGSFPVDSGSIRLSGENITNWPEHRRARLVGRVFQNPFSGTAPGMTIAENLTLAARRGLSRGLGPALTPHIRDEIRDRVRVLNMGLENRLDNPIGTLSGGQRQALTLLMATWLKPDLLLLDEHTAALDPKSAAQVIHLTHEIVARERITTLMVTHSMQQAVDLGDRIVMMNKGQVLHDISGAAKEGLKPEDLLRRFEDLRRKEQLERSREGLLLEAKGIDELMGVFRAIVFVDERVDEREVELLREFAERWEIPMPDLASAPTAGGGIQPVRNAVAAYLRVSPPTDQASELLDVLQHFVHADETVTEEETTVIDEVGAMVIRYVTGSSDEGRHQVVIVPQNEAQMAEARSMVPEVEATVMRGGTVYSVGRFFSAKYADLVCERYVAKGLFTTRIEL
jgi:putative ABC transport system ATP-binding protein